MGGNSLLRTRPKPLREQTRVDASVPDMAVDGFERHAMRRVDYQGPGDFTTEKLDDDDMGNDYPNGPYRGRF